MLNCISCGKEVSAEAKFCNSCGTEQKKPAASCNSCGKEMEDNEKFCSGCGTPRAGTPKKQAPLKSKTEAKPKEKKVLKKEKKAIVSEPKLDQKPPTPPPPPELKPSKIKIPKKMGWLDISLRVLFVLLIVIAFLPDFKKSNRAANKIDNKSEVEAILEENNISTEEEIEQETIDDNQEKIDDNQEALLNVSDEEAADKYRNGIGVEANQNKAFELYEKLADKGDLNAMVELADYYEQGIWVKKDTEKARQLLKKAADAGSIAAKWQLEFLESEK